MILNPKTKYEAYTLLELLIVLGIFAILGGMTFSSFGGLENTVKMNEYTLTLEQDVTSVQRTAMLLERSSGENWLYGIGIDFGEISTTGKYKVFKWCSPYSDYGDVTTESDIPAYDPSIDVGSNLSNGDKNGYIPIDGILTVNTCPSNSIKSVLVTLPGYDSSILPPKSNISITAINTNVPRFVVFEAVSGKTFFYDTDGEILNYTSKGELSSTDSFVITIDPLGNGTTRQITISNLSGRVSTAILQ